MPSKVIKANSMNETVLMKTEVALKAAITKQGSDMKISGKVIVWLSQVHPYSPSASNPCKQTPGTDDYGNIFQMMTQKYIATNTY